MFPHFSNKFNFNFDFLNFEDKPRKERCARHLYDHEREGNPWLWREICGRCRLNRYYFVMDGDGETLRRLKLWIDSHERSMSEIEKKLNLTNCCT